MAIATERAEKSHGWFSFSFLSRKKEVAIEKPQILTLKMDDIFDLPDNVFFTPFGQRLYGTLIVRSTLSDPQMSPALRDEVARDVKERCKKLKISEDQLSSINEQFMGLIKKRDLEMNSPKLILSSQK